METKTEMGTERSPPSFNERIRRAQKAVSSENWRAFKQIFDEDARDLLVDFDLFENTAINVATRSNNPRLLRDLLKMVPEEDMWVALRRRNCEQNTLLHEVALHEAVEMADVVFEFEKRAAPPWMAEEEEDGKKRLVEIMNTKNETPLFRAAKFGNLKMVKRMAKHVEETKGDMEIHLRSYNQSILHASVNGQYFDLALWMMMRIGDGETRRRLALEENKNGLTCLQILSRMPRAFRSHYSMGCFHKLLYNWLPEEGYEIEGCDSYELFGQKTTDIESGKHDHAKSLTSGVSRINYAFWTYLAKVFMGIDSLWKKKKQHKLAEHLAELFVKYDFSWMKSNNHLKKTLIVLPSVPYNVTKRKKQVERKEEKKQEQEDLQDDDDKKQKRHHYDNHTPLLIAASNGIIEIVELLLEEHPEAVNHVSEDEQNILHMAVKHRQIGIYRLLQKNPAFNTLASRISKENRTILHQVARMDYYRAAHLAGAAFQLQDELKWYKRVEQDVPSRFYLHCDQDNLTAGDVLDIEHDDMLRDAQSWIKETSQSCSTVAILVATVVFAAAYTIPGGSESGTPVFLRSPVFIFFTIMDVVALALSLASVVMFLSILTSPFELWDFHKSLPRKLNVGFAFLFLSLTTTMLAFSATILLTIRLQWKDWTSTLVYTAAFFPVTVFGMIEFPLYTKLPTIFEKVYKMLMKVVPIHRVIKYCFTRKVEKTKYP